LTDTTGNPPQNRDESSRFDRSDGRNVARGRDSRQAGRSRSGRSGAGRGGSRGRSDRGREQYRGQGSRSNKGFQRRDRAESEHKSVHNPADLRSANRPDRGRSPDIDEDVTGRELDKSVQRELSALDEHNRPWVQKHLVMAGRLMDEDPELAFEHALAASRRGGRLAVVREAAGMTAYAAGKFTEALREFRTYRRISGDNAHLPEMVDAERALGRTEKALEMAAEAKLDSLPVTSRVELAMVVAGIHLDQDDPQAAVKALEIPELNPRRGFSYSPRLFTAYADALSAAGRAEDARKWTELAAVAARALGQDVQPEPEIIDLGGEEDEAPASVRARDVVPPAERGGPARAEGGDR